MSTLMLTEHPLNFSPLALMVSSNHTTVSVWSVFQLGDHVLPVSSPHLQYISYSYFHLIILLSVLLKIMAATRIELCTPCTNTSTHLSNPVLVNAALSLATITSDNQHLHLCSDPAFFYLGLLQSPNSCSILFPK